MEMMPYQKELETAIHAVRKAGLVCRKVAQDIEQVKAVVKEDRSPVTLADFAGQAVISQIVQAAFPTDPIVGEETPEALEENPDFGRQVLKLAGPEAGFSVLSEVVEAVAYCNRDTDFKKRYWTLDPIDGTKGFLRGDQYALALALIEDGNVVLGVLGCPRFCNADTHPDNSGCMFYAVKGTGAKMFPLQSGPEQPVTVDSVTDSSNARICESFEAAHASHDSHSKISTSLGIAAAPLRMDSQVKYAAVARGDASIYLRLPRKRTYREKIWDHAAGAIIVEEAGGKVTDFSGLPIDFSVGKLLHNNRGIVATNGHLHQKVLEAIADVV
jgi:HAL2 family 3'(2'),5'-bisphosphate nucleotidase